MSDMRILVVFPKTGPGARTEENAWLIQLNNGDPDESEHPVLEAGFDSRDEAETALKAHYYDQTDAYVYGCYVQEVANDAEAEQLMLEASTPFRAQVGSFLLRYREYEPEWYVYDHTWQVLGSVIGVADNDWEVSWNNEVVWHEVTESDGVQVLWDYVVKHHISLTV